MIDLEFHYTLGDLRSNGLGIDNLEELDYISQRIERLVGAVRKTKPMISPYGHIWMGFGNIPNLERLNPSVLACRNTFRSLISITFHKIIYSLQVIGINSAVF